MSKIFLKPALTVKKQIELLRSRRLIISDYNYAYHCLKSVGYYRLSGYAKAFQHDDHTFRSGSRFIDVWNLYEFDHKLRVLTAEAIGRIEIAFRTAISNAMSIKYSAHWYQKAELFKNANPNETSFYEVLADTVRKICQKKKELFIKYYFDEYKSPDMPPSWMVLECISFGMVNLIFKKLRKKKDKTNISNEFSLPPMSLSSWIASLVYTRNLCAHHARLWNRTFVFRPDGLSEKMVGKRGAANCFYTQAYIIILLLKKISPESPWKDELFSLLGQHKNISKVSMGWDTDWQQDRIWSL